MHDKKRQRIWKKYGVFEEVEDEGQETVDSRRVITRKEKADSVVSYLCDNNSVSLVLDSIYSQ